MLTRLHDKILPHMKRLLLLTSLCCIMTSSCTLMEQRLASESGLYNVPLERSIKVPVDGFWLCGTGNPYAQQKKVNFYVAPLNVSLIREDYPELAASMVPQMHDLMKRKLGKAFAEANAANHTQWVVTEQEQLADVSFELAVVNLRKRRPGLHIAAKVLGYVAPTGVGDAVEFIAKGDITLEGAIRDRRSGRLLLAFKDANRAPLRFYHKDTYRQTGHVDANLKLWAEKLARLCRESAHDRLGSSTLQQKVKERRVKDVITTRVHDAL